MEAIGAIARLFGARGADEKTAEQNAAAHACMAPEQEIVEDAGVRKLAEILEGSRDTGRGDLVGAQAEQIAAVKGDASSHGLIDTRDDVEERGLAGAIGTDDGEELATRDRERDVGERGDASEADRQPLDLEQ